MIRYEIDLKQRSGKWMCRLERDSLEAIQAEWKRYTQEIATREPAGRRRLRLTKIEDGKRTVLSTYTPLGLLPRDQMGNL